MNEITPAQAERLRQIYQRCVEKMKEVVREFKVTEDELHTAGDYLNRLGKSGFCRSLVDMNLALTSAEVTNPPIGTPGNLEGPLYRKGHPVRADGNLLERAPRAGETPLTLTGRVIDAQSGKPVSGARLDFWQTDGEGVYDRDGDHMRGVIIADADGRYTLKTVAPKDYAEHDHDPIGELLRAMDKPNRRAGHIHVKIFVGDVEVLTTQLFVAGSEFLERDYVEGAVRDELIIHPQIIHPQINHSRSGDAHGAQKAVFDFAVVTARAR